MSQIAKRLAELGITLPQAVAPVANYVPFVRSGNLVFVSGQVSIGPDGLELGARFLKAALSGRYRAALAA